LIEIKIIPICDLKKDILKFLETHLKKVFNLKINILKLKFNIQFAYNSQRNQYLASEIINKVKVLKKTDMEKWLIIVDVDLYFPGLNFIFGLADINNGIAIISLSRLKQEFYGLPKDEFLFIERILKEATHELGHLFYLQHCNNPTCVMHFSNSIIDTDKKSKNFCSVCQKNLKRNLDLMDP